MAPLRLVALVAQRDAANHAMAIRLTMRVLCAVLIGVQVAARRAGVAVVRNRLFAMWAGLFGHGVLAQSGDDFVLPADHFRWGLEADPERHGSLHFRQGHGDFL